jgi:integrase
MKGEHDGYRELKESESLKDYYVDHVNIEGGTIRNLNTAWSHLQDYLKSNGKSIGDFGKKDAADFCEYLTNRNSTRTHGDISDRTASGYVGSLSRMADWLIAAGKIDYNPFQMAIKEGDPFEWDDTTPKMEVSTQELRDGIQRISNPIVLTFFILTLKTGVRISEALNLDYRAINIDHPISNKMPDPRAEVVNKPDTIYIDSSISEGEEHNGEIRQDGNKKKSYRHLPIDKELKDTLVWYIAMSPEYSGKPNPLFQSHSGHFGSRITRDKMTKLFREEMSELGWHDERNPRSYNVTPHWCRHWFTTVLRRRIDEDEVEIGSVKEYVKGLRGDTGSDVIETYTHEWSSNQWRTVYLDNIPQLYVGKRDN